MNRFTAFLKKLHLGRVLAVVLAGVVLLTTTACNSGNSMGARPNNPPVQMGGNNNPHKAGGDGYSEFKMSTDRAAINKRASLMSLGQLVAASPNTELQYRSSVEKDTGAAGAGRDQSKVEAQFRRDATQIPAERQEVIDRSDPKEQILEKVGQTFNEATGFLKDATESAAAGHPDPKTPAENR